MSASAFKPLFVVGCPRSGTTLVQRLLNAHPEVAIAPETFLVQKARRHSPPALIEALAAGPLFPAMGAPDAFHRAARAAHDPQAIFEALLRTFAAHTGASVVGEKTPDHVRHIPQLLDWFPRARVIHVVRDARAVVNSWRTVPWRSGYVARDAELWVEHVAAGRAAAATHPAAVHTVRFEALVRSPEATLRTLCRAVGLAFDPAMVHFHQTPPDTVDVEREPWKQRVTRPIDPSVATRWRTELPWRDVCVVEAVAGTEMRRWRYPLLSNQSMRRRAQWRARWQRLRWKMDVLRTESGWL
ncbi:sulfotransferase family protein [Salisaeta longa]|uniref:sulfotransferase family protein n=1 Tax=Salisaeta longa TaxID=503170 RepID=UPI0003B5458A|nr:sulfotransferase [Salisaeta longa]